MALLHAATLTPTKIELMTRWAPTQPWGPPIDAPLQALGAFRFDDPSGEVGIETHIVGVGTDVWQIPLTYRAAPLDGADHALAGQMEHSALGTRWVYDGLHDPVYTTMLAAVTLTGQGEALGLVEVEDRWVVAPSTVRIAGGGWSGGRVPVDGFTVERDDAAGSVLTSDRFRLEVFRRPAPGPLPPIALTATWHGLRGPVVLAAVSDRP